MKAILKFNLPEDSYQYSAAYNGASYLSVLWDLDEWLRGKIKYEGKSELQVVRDQLFELLLDAKVSIDD